MRNKDVTLENSKMAALATKPKDGPWKETDAPTTQAVYG